MFETVNGVALKLTNHIIQLETILSKTAPSLLKMFWVEPSKQGEVIHFVSFLKNNISTAFQLSKMGLVES